MTDTTNRPDTDSPRTATGTLEHLPPRDLHIDVNVRDDAALDAQFIASIREHGVLRIRGHRLTLQVAGSS